ncbi:hypothetical protein AAC387_Pa02g2500 [Persea americana]
MGGFLPFSFVAVFVIAAVVAVGYTEISPEVYWKKVLPNTPIPNSILEKLHAEVIDEKTGTSVDVGKGGVNVNTGKGKPTGGTTVNVGKGGVNVNTGKGKPNGGGTTVGVGRKGVGVNTGHGNTSVNVGKGGVNVNTGHKGKPVTVNVQPGGPSPFVYNYAASADQLHDDPNVALFFLEKDLHQGTKFNMFFPNSKSGPKFLPRNVVDAIPFSSAKISETLKHFSIEPNSRDAQTMMKTIKECEEPAVKGETKYCATSLESMVDFAKSKLGTNIKALATETKKEAPKQLYTIAPGVHKKASRKSVACHIEAYVHAVYYCHETSDTTAYIVPLAGKNKVKVDAVAVCHKDTSQWNPKHMAFQKLKVKPGSVPICHFIPEDHIVWVQN